MKLKAGAEVVGAGPVIGDGVVLTITSDSAAKATPYEEFESKGRGGQGVRVAKLGTAETVTLAWFGSLGSIGGPGDLLAQMADDEDPRSSTPTRCRSTSRPRSEISSPPRPNARSWSSPRVAGDTVKPFAIQRG